MEGSASGPASTCAVGVVKGSSSVLGMELRRGWWGWFYSGHAGARETGRRSAVAGWLGRRGGWVRS